MELRSLEHDFVNLALDHGVQRFLPMHGAPYAVLRGFGIHNAGMSFHHPPFEICRARQTQHSVFFCISGLGVFQTANGETRLREGELLHIPAGCPNRYWTPSEWKYIWVNLDDAGHWRAWEKGAEAKKNAHCIDYIATVVETMLDHDERLGNDEIMTQWMGLFVSYLERELLNPDERVTRLKAGMSAVWREVRLAPRRAWRVGELAAMAHMSVTHFKRSVREVHGMTPGQMLTNIRLERALTLMRGTDLTLDTIADLSGYSTSFALSKAFQRVYGTSPRRFARDISLTTPDKMLVS